MNIEKKIRTFNQVSIVLLLFIAGYFAYLVMPSFQSNGVIFALSILFSLGVTVMWVLGCYLSKLIWKEKSETEDSDNSDKDS